MRIRRLQQKDLDQTARIESENFSVPWTKEDFAGWVDREDGLFLAAEENGMVIGYCGVILAPPEGDITNVSVISACRGRGAGAALVKEMLKQTEELGVQTLFLEVRKSNEPAIRLYQKQGFREVGLRKKYYEKPVEDALIMKREAEEN